LRTVVIIDPALTDDQERELVEKTRSILANYRESKVLARIDPDPWEKRRYIVETGYFDLRAIDEIKELEGVSELASLDCQNDHLAKDHVASELGRLVEETEEITLAISILGESSFEINDFLDYYRKLNRLPSLVEEASDHYYLEIKGDSFRIGKKIWSSESI